MKAIFALFLVLMLTMSALQADAEHGLVDMSMGRKASAGDSDAAISTDPATTTVTSSETTASLSSTSASTPTTAAAATSNADAETGPQKHEKNDGYGNYSSTPASTDPNSSHHEVKDRP